jgi:Fe-Mn family superoxide dismutase
MGLLSGLQKRLGFEYNGMRNHEVYFYSLSLGAHILSGDSKLKKQIAEDFGSFDAWLAYFKAIATTRGVGWAMLYFDRKENRLLNAWVDEQHLGQLQDCIPVLALDMWEHAFIADYQPSGKKQYIEDFFENLNWEMVENNFIKAK